LKHLPKRAVSVLARIFNAVLRTQYFPQTWKHARVISIFIKPGKDPALPSSYRLISLLDTIGKLFKKILLATTCSKRTRTDAREAVWVHTQTARLCSWPASLKKLTRNFGEDNHRRTFPRSGQSLRYRLDRWHTLQANSPQLPVLHSPYNLILPQGLDVRGVFPFGHVISSRDAGWGNSRGINLPCPLQSVSDMPPPPHHEDLALYADQTAIIATYRKPTLLFSYLESYLNDLRRWLSEWKIAVNVSKSTAIIFARAGRPSTSNTPGNQSNGSTLLVIWV